MMTMGEILSRVRGELDELTPTIWKDEELRAWINDAVGDIARRTETVHREATIPLFAGIDEIGSLPSDFATLERIEWRDTSNRRTRLELRSYNELDGVWHDQVGNAGRPVYAGIRGHSQHASIRIFPVPAEAGDVVLYYAAIPTPLAVDGSDDATNLDVPSGWEDLVIAYATYRAQRRDRLASWQDAFTEYERSLQSMMSLTVLPHREHGMIRDTGMFDNPWDFY